MSSKTNYQRVAEWHAICGKEPGNASHLSTAIGVDAEELAEYLTCVRVSQDGWQKVLERIVTDLSDLATAIKSGKLIAHFPNHLRVDLLDAIVDREVTGNALAFLAGFNKDAADQEVLRANDSKLDADGRPVILPGGKIGKSSLYTPPRLESFV